MLVLRHLTLGLQEAADQKQAREAAEQVRIWGPSVTPRQASQPALRAIHSGRTCLQEAYRCSKLLAAAEDDRAKLQKVRSCAPLHTCRDFGESSAHTVKARNRQGVQEVKQRNEYASSLSAQVDAKTRSNEQHEKDARAAKAESLRLATALEDAELKKKVRT